MFLHQAPAAGTVVAPCTVIGVHSAITSLTDRWVIGCSSLRIRARMSMLRLAERQVSRVRCLLDRIRPTSKGGVPCAHACSDSVVWRYRNELTLREPRSFACRVTCLRCGRRRRGRWRSSIRVRINAHIRRDMSPSQRCRFWRSRARSSGDQPILLELLAQRHLRQLAGRRVRQLVDEHDVVRHPPLGDLAFVECEHSSRVDLAPSFFTTISSGRSSHLGCGTPITAASARRGGRRRCSRARSS